MPETTLHLLGPPRSVRGLQLADHDAVVALLRRCSAATLQRRFHANTDGVSYVTRLLADVTQEIGYGAWVAGRCIGLASLHPCNESSAEMAVLVEDAWHQRGVGSALASALARHARQEGWTSLRADVHGDNHFVPAALTRMGRTRTSVSSGVYTVWVYLGGAA
jgi:L-amino acid N-acyltransferase YncA